MKLVITIFFSILFFSSNAIDNRGFRDGKVFFSDGTVSSGLIGHYASKKGSYLTSSEKIVLRKDSLDKGVKHPISTISRVIYHSDTAKSDTLDCI